MTPRILSSDAQSVLFGTIQGRRFLEECQFEGGGNERERESLCGIMVLQIFVCFFLFFFW